MVMKKNNLRFDTVVHLFAISFRKTVGIFLVVSGVHVAGAQSYRGVIIDHDTRSPLEDVHIQVVNSSLGAVTDREGKFVINNFPKGQRIIRVSLVGYATIEALVSSEHKDSTLVLKSSYILLNNALTITAKRNEALSFDVSQSDTTLTKDELSKKNSRSTPEALMNESGIWVQKTNHGGGSPIIRGLVGNQILLLVDGIRLNNATYRYGPNQYLSTIDPGMVDRIDAIRGSGSVLYGSDALGGVVQVLSKTPLFSNNGLKVSGNLSGKWMSAGMEQSGRAEAEISSAKVAFTGGYSAGNFGDILAGGNLGFLDPTGYEERSGDAKLILRTGASGKVTAAFQQLTQNDVPRYDQVVQGGYSIYNFEPQTRQLSYLRWESSSENTWFQSFRVTTSLNRSIEGVKSQKNNSDDFKTQRDEVNTRGVIVEIISAPHPKWSIQSGAEYYFDKVYSTASTTNLISNVETIQRGSYADGSSASSFAVFTNHQYDISKFQFSAGARFNGVTVSVQDDVFGDQKITPNAIVGNVGLMMKLKKDLRAFISSNTGFRAPNVDDMSKFGAVESGVFEIPSANLSPEKSLSVETGFKFKQNRFSGTVSLYQTNLADLIDRVPATYLDDSIFEGRTVYQKQNVGEARLRGVEAETEVSLLKSLSAFGNITFTHGENITKQEPMRRIPPMFGRIGLRYHHTSGFWMNAEWATAGKQDRLAEGDKSDVRISVRLEDGVMPAWNILNLSAGYTFKFITLNVVGQNLFNQAYRIYASGIDGYGRSVRTSLTIRF
jgi:outer membrane receptor protein involved in Fe transport